MKPKFDCDCPCCQAGEDAPHEFHLESRRKTDMTTTPSTPEGLPNLPETPENDGGEVGLTLLKEGCTNCQSWENGKIVKPPIKDRGDGNLCCVKCGGCYGLSTQGVPEDAYRVMVVNTLSIACRGIAADMRNHSGLRHAAGYIHDALPSLASAPLPPPQKNPEHLDSGVCGGVTQWQPIATAPMDERKPLLLMWTGRGTSSGYWDFDDEFATRPKGWVSPECGWRGHQDMCIPRDQENCTHWMPLPAAPTGEGA